MWADDRKSLGITPLSREEGKKGDEDEDDKGILDPAEREEWIEEQKVCGKGDTA